MGLAQVNIKVKARQKYSKANEGRNVHISKSFFEPFYLGLSPENTPKGPSGQPLPLRPVRKKEKIRAEA